MRFSVVTPSYQQGRFIRDCIESVRAQDGVECEHIVMDAASTDETVSVLREYPHLQWVSERDQGQSDAINKGFRRATGDWLMWLNADDYLLPGALAQVRDFAERHPGARVIYGDCNFVSEDRQLLRARREGDFDYQLLLFYGCYIPSTATFYHRSIIDQGHFLDCRYRVCMDFDYYLRLAQAGFEFAHLPEILACFRWHGGNVSATQSKRRRRERLEVQRHYLTLEGRSYLAHAPWLRLLWLGHRARRWWRRRAQS